MKNKLLVFLGIIYMFMGSLIYGESLLSEEEIRWIEENPVIRVGSEENFAPFNFVEEDQVVGFSVDYLEKAAEKTGLRVEYTRGPGWNGLLEMIKQDEIDVMMNIIRTPERETYMSYTHPYARAINAIIAREGTDYSTFEKLSGKTIAIPKGYSQEELVKRSYPEINIYSTEDPLEALKAVLYGKADATVGREAVLTYLIRENNITNLVFQGEAVFKEKVPEDFHFSVKKDNEILVSILNKGIGSISEEEKTDIFNKWIIQRQSEKINLTQEEREWIRDNPVIRVENEGAFPPFNFREKGEAKGYSVDIINMIAEKTGLEIEYVDGEWTKLLDMVKTGELDVMPAIAKTPTREEYMAYTEAYTTNPNIIISKEGNQYRTLDELRGLKLALPRGYYQEEVVRSLYPDIELYLTEDSVEALKAVLSEKADAYVGDVAVAGYLMEQNFITGLKITGDAAFDKELEKIYMATGKENDILLSILNKGIKSITEEDNKQLLYKWLSFGEQKKIFLTREEQEYLEKKSSFVIGAPTGRPPYYYMSNTGDITGKLTDYVGVISKRLETETRYSDETRWGSIVDDLRNGDIDILGAAEKNSETEKKMLLTNPYLSIPLVIAARNNNEEIEGLDSVQDEKIAVVKDSMVYRHLAEKYPSLDFAVYKDMGSALKAVSKGRAFALVGSRETIAYYNEKHELKNIKIFTTDEIQEVSFGVDKNNPQLIGILNKVIGSLTEGERVIIRQRWSDIPVEKEFNWLLFWEVTFVLIAVIIAIVLWNRSLVTEVKKRKEMEEKFRIIADYTYDWESWFSPEGKLIWVNPGVERMFGYSVDECYEIKSFPENLICSNHKARFRASFERALRGKAKNDEVFKGIKKTGETIWIAISWNPVYDSSGKPLGVRSSARDFTDRKKAQEKLLASEEQSRLLLESASEGIFGTDTVGKATFINPSALEQLGYKKEEVLGRGIHELVHHSHMDSSYYSIKECPMYKSYTHGIPSKSVEEVLWKKDGTYINVEYTSTPILKGEQVMGSVIMFKDITKRLMAERELLEAKKTADKLIDNSPVPMAVIDLETQELMRINKEMERFHGISHKELHKYRSYDMYADVKKQKPELMAMIKRETGVDDYEVEIKKISTKEKRWVMLSSHKIKYMDRDAIIITMIDIHEIKKIQVELEKARVRAEAATKAKSNFLANMSHEIRTPMNAILGLNDLLKRTELTNKQKNYVDKVGRSAKNLLGIINDILDFSKIEAGKMDIEKVTFNLDNVLEGLSNISAFKAAEKGIEFVIEKDNLTSLNYVGDPLRIGQVLLNLTNNAIKFTENGEVLVRISSSSIDDKNVNLKFEVKDTGIGLTKEQKDKLFKAFTQADTSTTRKYGGTGLGLSISKHLVKLMGGSIGVESIYQKGSNFYFTLPLVVKRSEPNEKATMIKGLRVLVVDDNESARRVMGEYLKDFSCKTLFASSGEEAAAVFEDTIKDGKDIDLILMDLKMEGIDGIEAWKIIRSKGEARGKLPKIILVTAYGREDIIERARMEGIESTLMKPLSQSLLFDDIMETLGMEGRVLTGKETGYDIPEEVKNIKGSKILVAEDNLINQEVIKAILEEEGFEVHIEGDGQKTIDALEKIKDFDLILMDLQMPVLDGYEAAVEIRKTYTSEELPIIALSADAMSGTKEEVEKAGMDGYVTKPIDKTLLFETLTKFIAPREKNRSEKTPEDEIIRIKEIVKDIDVEEGLHRVAGNIKLYTEILKKFSRNNKNMAEDISRKTTSDEEDLRRVHTLKGVAGNIGAKKIYKLAVELELRLKSGKPVEDILAMLDKELKKISEEIEFLRESESQIKEAENTIDTAELKKELSYLKGLIEDNDTDAQERLENMNLDLGGKVTDIVIKLRNTLDNYDFEAAEKELEKLEKAIEELEV